MSISRRVGGDGERKKKTRGGGMGGDLWRDRGDGSLQNLTRGTESLISPSVLKKYFKKYVKK